MKYIIELDEIPNTGLFKARGANTLVFDKRGIKNILKPYKEEPEIDWLQVAVDTPILVRDDAEKEWKRGHFAEYKDGYVFAWKDCRTSWTSYGVAKLWRYAKLAGGDKNEKL